MKTPNLRLLPNASLIQRLAGPRWCALFALFLAACGSDDDRTFAPASGGTGGNASGGLGGSGASGGSSTTGGSAGSGGSAGTSTGASGGQSGSGGTGAAAGTGGTGAGAGTGGTGAAAGTGGTGAVAGTGGTGGVAGSGGIGGMSSGGVAGTGAASTGGMAGVGGAGCTTSDPDCVCVGGVVRPRDVDTDGHGTMNCAEAPGDDCNDGDITFWQNACGGCVKNLGGLPAGDCGQCGVFECSGTDNLTCVSPVPQPRQCRNNTTREYCVAGAWVAQAACSGSNPVCVDGACKACLPGTYRCRDFSGGQVVDLCAVNASWGRVESCYDSSNETCNANTGTCTSFILHPRDDSFEIVPALDSGILPHSPSDRPTRQVLDLATGFEFA